MHDIKYFFLNKNNQTIQGAKKIREEREQITENIIENIIFKNPEEHVPAWTTLDPPVCFGKTELPIFKSHFSE
jgi:hypothetical protein